MMRLSTGDSLAILDFDIENRPLSYWVPERPTAEVTAIAWCWVGEPDVRVSLLGEVSGVEMLAAFRRYYDVADMVTGHNIRRHDLPILNGAMLEVGLPPLAPKMTQDTYADLQRMGDLPRSQKELAEMFDIPANKFEMSQHKWRQANRLTREGLALTRQRVVGDVRQHMALREVLLGERLLDTPRVWRP